MTVEAPLSRQARQKTNHPREHMRLPSSPTHFAHIYIYSRAANENMLFVNIIANAKILDMEPSNLQT